MALDGENEVNGKGNPVTTGPGGRLRAAREQAGLGLDQIAAQTRIAVRHLAMIEEGDFGSLPARTYATGFTRTYAKVLGLDDNAIVREVRQVLDTLEPHGPRRPDTAFEPGDPARIPPPVLGWVMLAAVLLLLAGGYAFYRSFFAPAGQLPAITQTSEEGAVPEEGSAAEAQQPVDASGAVVFTAMEEGIWVKFYEAGGRQLMQKQMAKGETYRVPAEARDPQVWTGRPDALAITIGGKPVPALAERETVMRDVPVSAAALLQRGKTPSPPTAGVSPTG